MRFLQSFVFIILFFIFAFIALAFAEGYLFSPKAKKLVKTGVLNIAFSFPGADLLLDGKKQDGAFPMTLRIPPGGYAIRIERSGFFHWEKNIVLSEENISEIHDLYLVPEALVEKDFIFSYVLPQKSRGEDFFPLPDNRLAFYNRSLGAMFFFHLQDKTSGILERIVNLPFVPEKILDLNSQGIIFGKKDGAIRSFDFSNHAISKSETSFSLLKKPKEERIKVSESSQEIVLQEGGKLVLADADSGNQMTIFEKDVLLFFGSEDGTVIAAILPNRMIIFSLRAWRESVEGGEREALFSRLLSTWVPGFYRGTAM